MPLKLSPTEAVLALLEANGPTAIWDIDACLKRPARAVVRSAMKLGYITRGVLTYSITTKGSERLQQGPPAPNGRAGSITKIMQGGPSKIVLEALSDGDKTHEQLAELTGLPSKSIYQTVYNQKERGNLTVSGERLSDTFPPIRIRTFSLTESGREIVG